MPANQAMEITISFCGISRTREAALAWGWCPLNVANALFLMGHFYSINLFLFFLNNPKNAKQIFLKILFYLSKLFSSRSFVLVYSFLVLFYATCFPSVIWSIWFWTKLCWKLLIWFCMLALSRFYKIVLGPNSDKLNKNF